MQQRDGETLPFFLGGTGPGRPTTMAAGLAPDFRYYSSLGPLADPSPIPVLLVMSDDDSLAATSCDWRKTR